MDLPTPLLRARLLRRYKRFLADIVLEEGPQKGEEVTAHIANPGAMLGLQDADMRILVSKNDDPKRKLKYSWELCAAPEGGWVGVSTAHPNRIVEEALLAKRAPELAAYPKLRREVKYGENSRIDFLLSGPNLPDAYVEVKNVHLRREEGVAEFPDSVTARGAKHLRELANMRKEGARAVMFYLIQRADCTKFKLANDIDPAYAKAFKEARAAGVEAVAYSCEISPPGITLDRKIAIIE